MQINGGLETKLEDGELMLQLLDFEDCFGGTIILKNFTDLVLHFNDSSITWQLKERVVHGVSVAIIQEVHRPKRDNHLNEYF